MGNQEHWRKLKGIQVFEGKESVDNRGKFRKSFTSADFSSNQPPIELAECFISTSHKGVIRGMHLQIGSAANYRLVQVLDGAVEDVVLDLRAGSSTYGEMIVTELSESNARTILIPPGVAHGFQALEPSRMLYLTSSTWEPKFDTGVNPFSINHNWPLPVSHCSDRDQQLIPLSDWPSK
ncbi:RfbC dTDP-4-dehydrorhamnose 3,5-epimerase and related enzymes [Candidatus Nanopelagicaceae bacterium]